MAHSSITREQITGLYPGHHDYYISVFYQYNGYSGKLLFANAIMLYQTLNKGGQSLICKIKQCKIKGVFDIHDDISDYVTLVTMVDTVGGVNNVVIIAGNFIFDSNHEKSLPLAR